MSDNSQLKIKELEKSIDDLTTELKIKHKIIEELNETILEKEKQIVRSEAKALSYREKLDLIEIDPETAKLGAKLEYELKVARTFIQSGAFQKISPEQAYVLMKAGGEMNLSPVQSMSDLYIVNGIVGFHGKGLTSRLTSQGVKFKYEDESEKGVTVIATYDGETFKEIVKSTDAILLKSNAMKISPKNKMRFHGMRMIANFYLAHLLGAAAVWDQDDMEAAKLLEKGDEYAELKFKIESCKTLPELEKVQEENKKILTSPKNIDLLVLCGQIKKDLK